MTQENSSALSLKQLYNLNEKRKLKFIKKVQEMVFKECEAKLKLDECQKNLGTKIQLDLSINKTNHIPDFSSTASFCAFVEAYYRPMSNHY